LVAFSIVVGSRLILLIRLPTQVLRGGAGVRQAAGNKEQVNKEEEDKVEVKQKEDKRLRVLTRLKNSQEVSALMF
jgi:hypothetical protein